MKILIVEDSPIISKAYSTALRKQRHQVDTAADGVQALLMAKNKYDLILMDIYVPHINGIDITSKLRKQINIGNPIIIGITSDTDLNRHHMCLQSGMNEVLLKTTELTNIISTINKYQNTEWGSRR